MNLHVLKIALLLGGLCIIAYSLYKFFRKPAPAQYYSSPIKQLAKNNTYYRQVVHTTPRTEVTLMAIQPHDEIPKEVHNGDQVIMIVEGTAESILNGTSVTVETDSLLVVPAGTEHTIKNPGSELLKLFTIYAPPQHTAGTIHKTKADEPEHQ